MQARKGIEESEQYEDSEGYISNDRNQEADKEQEEEGNGIINNYLRNRF